MVLFDPRTNVVGIVASSLRVWVPGQSKTHGNSGFENDVEDLVTDLPAAFVANDVPAAFCAPEVFVDAAMIDSDSWVSMLGAALSAFDDAAMFCFRLSMQNDDSGASTFMKSDGFWGRFLVPSGVLRIVANSGSSFLVSPCGLMAVRVLGVFAEIGVRCSFDFGVIAELNGGRCSWYIGVIAELNGCCYCVPGQSLAADLLCSGALGFAGPLEHVAAAAFGSSDHSDLLVASAAKETEYMLCIGSSVYRPRLLQHSALGIGSLCMRGFLLQERFARGSCSSSSVAGNWLSGFLLLWCVFWCQRRDPGKVLPSLLGKLWFTSEKVKVKVLCEVFDLQASTQEAI